MRSPGRTYARSQISEHVWNTHFDTGSNMVDVAVARLRKKIDDGAEVKPSDFLQTLVFRVILDCQQVFRHPGSDSRLHWGGLNSVRKEIK